MKKKDVVKYYGTQEKVATALGLTRQAIVAWGPVVPQGQAYKLQAITGGKLKVLPELYKRRGSSV
jgi:hypothetical protein